MITNKSVVNVNLTEKINDTAVLKEIQKGFKKILKPVTTELNAKAPTTSTDYDNWYKSRYGRTKQHLKKAGGVKVLSGGAVVGGIVYKRAKHSNIVFSGTSIRRTDQGYNRGRMDALNYTDQVINRHERSVTDQATKLIIENYNNHLQ